MRILRIIWKVLLSLVAIFIVLFIIAMAWLKSVSPGTTEPITNQQGEVIENSVAEIEYPTINDSRQFILIRGKNIENPVLLMVHGGPGSPQVMLNQLHNRELENHFIVVNWDQRGAGASYNADIPDETFTIDQFIEDTHELTNYLKQKFNQDKIFILGHSWGSYLSTRTVEKYPNDYYAYIGIGQVSDQIKSEQLSYQAVLNFAKERNDEKAIKQLEAITFNDAGLYSNFNEDIMTERKWVNEYGGAAYGKTNKDVMPIILKTLLLFPEYEMEYKLNYMKGLKRTQNLLFPQMLEMQLVNQVKEVEVPYYVLQGKHDLQTVSAVAKTYFDSLLAPSKEFIEFENSAHMVPYGNEVDKFHETVIRIKQEVMGNY